MMPSEDRGQDQMANPEDVGILQQGVARWNDWRKTKDGPSLDLSGADLRNRDLNGADLRAVNLSKTVLRGAKFGKGSLLWNANLSGADLYGANLRGADLQDVNFSGADLFQADLRESNLQGADLSTAKGGLLSRQLAGADLTGAKLPEPLGKLYDSLSSVKEISDSAQKLFLALLAGCLYSWLTIAQTTDVDLITNRASTPLPIIQAAIPIVGFYVVAPLILLCLYFYFHFYLQKLWEELGSLPAVFSDGRLLHNRTDPWLLNDLVRSHFVKLKDGRPFLSYFQAWVSVVLAWWLVPVTLFCFWLRYIRRHDLFWTMVHAVLLALVLCSAVRLYRTAARTLRGNARPAFRLKEVVQRRDTYLRLSVAVIVSVALIVISAGAVFGQRPDLPQFSRAEVPSIQRSAPRTWIPTALERMGYSPFANLNYPDVSSKPSDWVGKKEEELDRVKGADLTGRNLRYARADEAFLAKSNLSGSDLYGASLIRADLRQSNLVGSDLQKADLRGALLQGANLGGARLAYAQLGEAQLKGADLFGSSLYNAFLPRADLKGADLRMANLRGTAFYDANLHGVSFDSADLTDVHLQGAVIKYADFQLATAVPAKEEILKSRDWNLAFFPSGMLAQLGLPPDHNEKLE
jgi:uncharacterized protein YjbI with pentapeptide repeats